MNDLTTKVGMPKLQQATQPLNALNQGLQDVSSFGFHDFATLDYEMDGSSLPANDFTTIGGGVNRWQYLFFDPQKNSIEPFRRIGENTVLSILDTHAGECFPIYQSQ
mgnify:CR=1 FL=1|jgi:hypothetical protein|tara:strand:+ start:472 stop:792 length:321 start_codon:yes stop_codon:yes gene_type:complete